MELRRNPKSKMKDIKIFVNALCIFWAFILNVPSVFGQDGYHIEIEAEGLGTEAVILGNFYGSSTYIADTSKVENGIHVFSGDQSLPRGMYFVAMDKKRLFDFVVFKDQHFRLTTDSSDFIMNLAVDGDLDNQLFIDDMKYNAVRNEEAAPFLSVLQDSSASQADRQAAQAGLSAINDAVLAHQQEVIREYPESFMAKVFKARQRERLPDDTDEDKAFNYYKDHYWDHFDLSDPMFLRLNQRLYQEKLDTYLDKLVMQRPDSLIKEIDQLAKIASKNSETYKYYIWTLVNKYMEPRIMGLDEIFVHLNDTYFATGEMDYWTNNQLKKNVADYADRLRNSLIGKKAPELIMQDGKLERRSLYDIENEFTIIYFFDPDCHHCKLATPQLNELYDQQKFDMEVYAVSTDTSMVKMNKYIREMGLDWIIVNGPRTFTKPYYELYDAMTTPTFYILDRDKRIIAKKLPVDRIEEFLTRYEARKDQQ
jgi:peroxiredoxin